MTPETLLIQDAGRTVAVIEHCASKRGMFPFKVYMLVTVARPLRLHGGRRYLGEWYTLPEALQAIKQAITPEEECKP